MKTSIMLALVVALTMFSCGKDKFQTVPQLKLKSKNPDVVPPNIGTLRLNIEYTDKEGDVTDSILIVRQRLNVNGAIQKLADPYSIPDFPKTDKGEFEITLEYQRHLVLALGPIRVTASQNEIDTLRLKIVARDKAGNKSDTLVVDNVYVCRDASRNICQ